MTHHARQHRIAPQRRKVIKHMSGNPKDPGTTVVSKITSILLAVTPDSTHTVTELARSAGLPLSTAHRLTTELLAARLLEVGDDGRLHAGLSLRTIAGGSNCATTIRAVSAPVIDDISEMVGNRVRLGMLVTTRRDGRRHLGLDYVVGTPGCPVSEWGADSAVPLHATAMGKVLLAFAGSRNIAAVVAQGLAPYTHHTITDPERFRRVLSRVRQRRFAVADQELQLDDRALAVPVFGSGGRMVAALEARADGPYVDAQILRPILAIASGSLSRQISQFCCFCLTKMARHFGLAQPVALPALLIADLPSFLGCGSACFMHGGQMPT